MINQHLLKIYKKKTKNKQNKKTNKKRPKKKKWFDPHRFFLLYFIYLFILLRRV